VRWHDDYLQGQARRRLNLLGDGLDAVPLRVRKKLQSLRGPMATKQQQEMVLGLKRRNGRPPAEGLGGSIDGRRVRVCSLGNLGILAPIIAPLS